MKLFKPMLASTCKDVTNLTLPVLASIKLDGVRATVQGGQLLSRTLKPIPNRRLQERLKGLPEGLDGELIAGDPAAPDCYRKTVSIVMSEDKPVHEITYNVFDRKMPGGFMYRLQDTRRTLAGLVNEDYPVKFLEHSYITTANDLYEFEEAAVTDGHEGVMVRSLEGPYKEGRSTVREGFLLKIKRFEDSEALVLGITELQHNGNEPKRNELGRTQRSTHKAGKVGMGVMGALQVKDMTTGVEFEIGTGFTGADRVAYWILGTGGVIGRIAKYKFFALGSKDKPRFPVFLGWRDKRDM